MRGIKLIPGGIYIFGALLLLRLVLFFACFSSLHLASVFSSSPGAAPRESAAPCPSSSICPSFPLPLYGNQTVQTPDGSLNRPWGGAPNGQAMVADPGLPAARRSRGRRRSGSRPSHRRRQARKRS
uniref:Uncharacterized protein n=1 Tax=Opuntia streptacantha TaxID=393608 RepID=A0A7C9EAN6_OPUST